MYCYRYILFTVITGITRALLDIVYDIGDVLNIYEAPVFGYPPAVAQLPLVLGLFLLGRAAVLRTYGNISYLIYLAEFTQRPYEIFVKTLLYRAGRIV